jgi:putative ATP-grasp target RiPP
MLIELLTPLMLASAPATVPQTTADLKYDHALQRSVGNNKGLQLAWSTMTASGTQTYGVNGRPFDSDNDSDQG